MNKADPPRTPLYITAIGVLGTFLIMAVLVGIMHYYTRPPALNAARAEERRKNLLEIQSTSQESLASYGWTDQAKGLVRVPLTNAMEIMAREWQHPAAGRSNFLLRVEKALAKPPEAPNPFE